MCYLALIFLVIIISGIIILESILLGRYKKLEDELDKEYKKQQQKIFLIYPT